MEGRVCPEGLLPEQFEEAQRIYEVTQQAAQDELWRMACLMASKDNGAMLGQAEFQLRELLHRLGAVTIQNAVNERRKKGATSVVALPAAARTRAGRAATTRGSSVGGHERS